MFRPNPDAGSARAASGFPDAHRGQRTTQVAPNLSPGEGAPRGAAGPGGSLRTLAAGPTGKPHWPPQGARHRFRIPTPGVAENSFTPGSSFLLFPN